MQQAAAKGTTQAPGVTHMGLMPAVTRLPAFSQDQRGVIPNLPCGVLQTVQDGTFIVTLCLASAVQGFSEMLNQYVHSACVDMCFISQQVL
jgi:hypothetical protein